jgi:hypothetical protein
MILSKTDRSIGVRFWSFATRRAVKRPFACLRFGSSYRRPFVDLRFIFIISNGLQSLFWRSFLFNVLKRLHMNVLKPPRSTVWQFPRQTIDDWLNGALTDMIVYIMLLITSVPPTLKVPLVESPDWLWNVNLFGNIFIASSKERST